MGNLGACGLASGVGLDVCGRRRLVRWVVFQHNGNYGRRSAIWRVLSRRCQSCSGQRGSTRRDAAGANLASLRGRRVGPLRHPVQPSQGPYPNSTRMRSSGAVTSLVTWLRCGRSADTTRPTSQARVVAGLAVTSREAVPAEVRATLASEFT